LDVHQFFSTVGDKIGRVPGFNPVLESIIVMKVAIILIALSLLISSLALLVPATSHYQSKTGSGFDFDTTSIPDELK
jgi:hypothetical protein